MLCVVPVCALVYFFKMTVGASSSVIFFKELGLFSYVLIYFDAKLASYLYHGVTFYKTLGVT